MSHFSKIALEVLDLDCLIEALQFLGFSPEVTIDLKHFAQLKTEADRATYLEKSAANLYGYYGDAREQKAHVIVRRDQISDASNDLGFVFDGEKFSMYISEYDQREFAYSEKYKGGFGAKLLNEYCRLTVIKQAEKLGQAYTIEPTATGYQIKIQVPTKTKAAVGRVSTKAVSKVGSKLKSRY